jgi:bifunctional polynucleotide phosphatase/kinase
MVGRPASGKSTYSKILEKAGYERVNRDTLKTMPKCEKAAIAALEIGKSVVIDNTNPHSGDRFPFIQIAKDNNVPVRCFYVNTEKDVIDHLNLFRERTQNIRRIPDVAYNMFNKKFEKPQKKEGFDEIIEIDFVPQVPKENEKYFLHKY